MQLLAIVLYNADGRIRRLDFKPGELNIVTGESGTGKSALLTIVDYCLGRDKMLVPVGVISKNVEWYGALWQLEGTGDTAMRAFTGRPKPAAGKQSTSVAMLEFGANLEPPAYESLQPNSDTRQLRQQLGSRIGIDETSLDSAMASNGLDANLGHAALLCLQTQSEVANQALMFHRQGEAGMEQTLRDIIPYFLGAVPRDHARKRSMLRDARRTLNRLQTELTRVAGDSQTIDVELASLLAEARGVGLLAPPEGSEEHLSRAEVVRMLSGARSSERPTVEISDGATQDERDRLDATRDRIGRDLRDVLEERGLLLKESRAANEVSAALDQQHGRLTSLGLFEATAITPTVPPLPVDDATAMNADAGEDASGREVEGIPGDSAPNIRDVADQTDALSLESHDCPACGSHLHEPDPTAAALHKGLAALTGQISVVAVARPAQRRAMANLDDRIEDLRGELRSVEGALEDLARGQKLAQEADVRLYDFTRGRIDSTLMRARVADEYALQVLRAQVEAAQNQVMTLEAELAEFTESQNELAARLRVIGSAIRDYAERLQLEHSETSVVLDLSQLTVLAETVEGTAPLSRIGSAKNWVGYHIATHLALHRFFVTHDRPVPRILILDQPTQAHYPSEQDNTTGEPVDDADRIAVRAMFELMRDVVAELAPDFQVIVLDHADLPEDWFARSVRYRWRSGRSEIAALIPDDWLTDALESGVELEIDNGGPSNA